MLNKVVQKLEEFMSFTSLSRKGRIEHPHLIRVHHLSRNGVHLRDVKRWLAELRGKDLPESFAWSYKRRYKSGFVWQDLLDEDLITPISDNEYVLKGSEISSTCSKEDALSEKKSPTQTDASLEEEAKDSQVPFSKEENQHLQETTLMDGPRKTSSEIEEESPKFGSEKSTLTDDSDKVEEEKHSDESKQDIHEENDKFENPSYYSTPSNKKNKKTNNGSTTEEKVGTPTSSTSSAQTTFTRSRSYSNGASHLFRNLITCGAVDTNDSTMVTVNRRNKSSLNVNFTKQNHQNGREFFKGDKLGGSQRIFGTSWNQQPQHAARRSLDGAKTSTKNKNEFGGSPRPSAAYKPINGPQCSQCGKQFKPEKLHAHMKSCKGMKTNLAKGSNPAISVSAVEKASDRSTEFPVDNNSISAYYLTQRN